MVESFVFDWFCRWIIRHFILLLFAYKWPWFVGICMGTRGEHFVCDLCIIRWHYSFMYHLRCGISPTKGILAHDLLTNLSSFDCNLCFWRNSCFFMQIRTIGSAMISVVHSFTSFIALKLFPILLEIVALHGCMTILAIGCIVGSFFIAFAMKETAGQSLDDVDTKEKMKMESIHGEPLLQTEKQNLEQK